MLILAFAMGLLDYLPDESSQNVIKRVYEALKPNGKLVVSGTSVSNPLIFRMSLALDHHVVYRSDQDFKELFEKRGLCYDLICNSESTAQFFVIRKK